MVDVRSSWISRGSQRKLQKEGDSWSESRNEKDKMLLEEEVALPKAWNCVEIFVPIFTRKPRPRGVKSTSTKKQQKSIPRTLLFIVLTGKNCCSVPDRSTTTWEHVQIQVQGCLHYSTLQPDIEAKQCYPTCLLCMRHLWGRSGHGN